MAPARSAGNVARLLAALAALRDAHLAEGGLGRRREGAVLAASDRGLGSGGASLGILRAAKPKVKVKDAQKVMDSINRYGDEANETEDDYGDEPGMLDGLNPFSENHVQQDRFKCGRSYKVNSKNHGDDRCPRKCPYFVQDKTDNRWCSFTCVREEDCTVFNPTANIPDKERGICRSCMVDHCAKCDETIPEDRCAVCNSGYVLDGDGQCVFAYAGAIYTVLSVIGVIVLLVLVWVVDMAWRPISNPHELKRAEVARAREKIRMDPDEAGNRKLFPFGTNLHTKEVAGPGMNLHFNFQASIILWAVLVACVYMCFCAYVDEDLWYLGTRKYGTPRQNCILVAWGYQTQHRLMWAKVMFLWIVYIMTFLLCVIYGISQLRTFQDLDAKNTTMKDYAAMLTGIEGLSANRRLEEELKDGVERAIGQKVIGVSVAWHFSEDPDTVRKALRKDLDDLFEANRVQLSPMEELPQYGPVRGALYKAEQTVFGLNADAEEMPEDERIKEAVMAMHSSPRAIVVFDTEEARDTALEKSEGGFAIPDVGTVTLEEITAEPDSVIWENFGRDEDHLKFGRIMTGFVIIGLACLFWAMVFYGPYAYYLLTFDYSNGREPGFIVSFAFSMIVVIGNAIMYEVCARISDWVGFRFRDQREACYMILYTIACMFNVLLDFVTTYMLQEIVLEALRFRTYFGQPIGDVATFTEKFQTYGMQRALAENTYTYAFPSTFLIPFLIEFGPTILAPWYVGRLIVKNHPEVRGSDAEEWLAMVPMDMGRYADILLNTILGILIFFFPGGYTWSLFLAMAASHLFIYGYDYYKVLRQIPHCDYVAYDIEWWCQAMFAPVVAIIAAALVFKSNCEPGYHCVRGDKLVALCALAWLGHTLFHLAVLSYVVPRLGKRTNKPAELEVPFLYTASHIPSTWFTANPVHCLRSKYFYEHSPPCDYYWPGKESLMRENEDLGCHFKRSTKGFRLEMNTPRDDDAEKA